MQLDRAVFHRQFLRFQRQIEAHSGRPFTSFSEGLPADWEDYKGEVHRAALARLAAERWRQKQIGGGKILERTIDAIEIDEGWVRNNLVLWKAKYGPKGQTHRPLLDARTDTSSRRDLEGWLFDFFVTGETPHPVAFERLRELGVTSYDLVAYLFFLRDRGRYMPISTTTFDQAFADLGIDLVTARHCSWDNYERYNDALRAVQDALHDEGVTGAGLLDAHSFCWMLVRQEIGVPAPRAAIAPPEPGHVSPVAGRPPPTTPVDPIPNVVTEEELIERDGRRRLLGAIAQNIALDAERARLRRAGHPDPDSAARAVWDELARGYDILSEELDGTQRYIEVKAARGSASALSFVLTENERAKSMSLENYFYYLVIDPESDDVRVIEIPGRAVTREHLTPMVYRATITTRAAK